MKHTAHFPTRKWLKKKQQQKLDLSQLPTVLMGSLQMYLTNLRRAVSNKAFISSGDKSVKFILDTFSLPNTIRLFQFGWTTNTYQLMLISRIAVMLGARLTAMMNPRILQPASPNGHL